MTLVDDLECLQTLFRKRLLDREEFDRAKHLLLHPDPEEEVAGAATSPAVDSVEASVRSPSAPKPSDDLRKNNPLSLTGFILGLASIVFYTIGIVPVLAIVFGSIGAYRFDERAEKNKWMAPTGIALGVIPTLLCIGRGR